MRTANLDGRLVLVAGDRAVDVERASGGRFGRCPMSALERWDEFSAWAGGVDMSGAEAFDPQRLGPPVPGPPQVFGIGLNYRDHAAEAGLDLPSKPMVFTKFPSSITGPYAEVQLRGDKVDWEVEMVVVIGRQGHQIAAADAWSHVAGVTVGQDISDRKVQFASKPPQFSMGKSFPGYSPIGPVLVTPDELPNRDSLGIGCSIDGETMQDGTTSDLIFPVAELIAEMSQIVIFLPGDIIYTGTPAGVGSVREPRRYLKPGESITSWIEGVGEICTRLT